MDNQENLEELQEFDLDSILNEFGSGTAPSQEDGTAEVPVENPEADLPTQVNTPPEAEHPAEENGDAQADNTLEADPVESDEDFAKRLEELLGDLPPEQAEDTQVFSGEKEESTSAPVPAATEETIRLDAISDLQEPPAPKEPIPIRSNIRELKRKIVAGPEKRYYELSDSGLLKLQIALFASFLIVVLCVATTTLFTMGMVPENRLKLVIYSQVLAMLGSALLGCYQMMDGIADMFHGRFTINSMLFFTLLACGADAMFCLQELRVPCCACFALEMTFALFGRYHRRTTEMSQMDTLRKAIHLNSIVKEGDYLDGGNVLLRGEGDVDDFMDTYSKPSTPEKLQSVFCFIALLACIAIAAVSGMRHGISLAIQVLSTSLLVAVPASFFVALTRPAALLQRRLHMVGTVLCGWQGITKLLGKAYFPMKDADLFPSGSTKLNGVKFYGSREKEQVLSYTASLITAAGGGLVPLFQNMLKNRGGSEYAVENFHDYGQGGIGGEIGGEIVLMGDLNFLQSMDVEIPQGTTVSQAVYVAIGGKLCAVIAISYAKMRSASAGLVSLTAYRKIRPVLLCDDFLLTDEFIRGKFGVNTRRMVFPDRQTRQQLAPRQANPESPVLALTIREELVSSAYAVTGANALYHSSKLGLMIHMLGGIIGLLVMFVLGFQGSTQLLTPTNVLLYQLIWMIPGLLITEWTRTV